jgi:hypothetical protein
LAAEEEAEERRSPEGQVRLPKPPVTTAAAMATHPALSNLGIAPRLLTREQTAAYCGVGLTTFTAWIRRGIVPGPVHRTHRWDRKAIDAALDVLSGIDAKLEGIALDQWKAKHRAHHTERDSPS